jgi:AraC family transcriptional activator of pobA
MSRKTNFIAPLFRNQVKEHGVHIFRSVAPGSGPDPDPAWPPNIVHRDENYLFIFQKKGRSILMLDFKTVELTGPSLFFILPGQIHHPVSSDTELHVLVVEPSLVQATYKEVLDQYFLVHDPVRLSAKKLRTLDHCLSFLSETLKHDVTNPCGRHITRGLVDAILGFFTQEYVMPEEAQAGKKEGRNITITRQFKSLLFKHYKIIKKPSDYAGLMRLSTPYLNEAVKEISGNTVSYWIQKMIITEAKRLLYFTDWTVKEIAINLGYEDHAYFSRLFTLAEEVSPVGYRKRHR